MEIDWKVNLNFIYYSILLLSTNLSANKMREDSLFQYQFPTENKIKLNPENISKCMWLELSNNIKEIKFNRKILGDGSFTDFTDYLGAKSGRKYDYASGMESELRFWILRQSDNSIDPVNLFVKSMELNDYNVFTSTLTIHQLLRNEARFLFEKRYDYQSTENNYVIFYNKFIDIRGDLVERGPGFNGDHACTWYRLWGTMLYRFMWEPEQRQIDKKLSIKQKISQAVGLQGAIALGTYVELSKFVRPNEYDWKRKIEFNKVGAKMAEYLMKFLFTPNSILFGEKNLHSNCQERYYLKKSELYSQQNPNTTSTSTIRPVDFSQQLSLSKKQSPNLCYAYSYSAALEASLYRFDKTHRNFIPEYFVSKALAHNSTDPFRIFKILTGNTYSSGSRGFKGVDMIFMLHDENVKQPTYISDERFLYSFLMVDTIKFTPFLDLWSLLRDKNYTSEIVNTYKILIENSTSVQIEEKIFSKTNLIEIYNSRLDSKSLIIPLLNIARQINIPPIINFKFNPDKVQKSTNSGKSWIPISNGLPTFPTWHSVVLQQIIFENGISYLIFKDSSINGTLDEPHKSQLRIRVDDAVELITQMYFIVGEWDLN